MGGRRWTSLGGVWWCVPNRKVLQSDDRMTTDECTTTSTPFMLLLVSNLFSFPFVAVVVIVVE